VGIGGLQLDESLKYLDRFQVESITRIDGGHAVARRYIAGVQFQRTLVCGDGLRVISFGRICFAQRNMSEDPAFVQPANGVFGNVGAVIPGIRNPKQLAEDLALSKIFNLRSEKKTLEFRGSAFNIANPHLISGLGLNPTTSTYGLFSNPQANLPRNVEFSLRFKF